MTYLDIYTCHSNKT